MLQRDASAQARISKGLALINVNASRSLWLLQQALIKRQPSKFVLDRLMHMRFRLGP